MTVRVPRVVSEGQRLESLRRLGVLEPGTDAALDDLVDLLRTVIGADAAALTLVDATRAWPMAAAGTPRPSPVERSRSAADLVLLRAGAPLWIEEVASHGQLRWHPWGRAVPEGTVAAATVLAPDGQPVGAFEVLWRSGRRPNPVDDGLLGRAAEQLATRLELRAEVVEYRRFVELAPDAMAVLDLDGAVELCNPAFADLLRETDTAQILGRTFLELVVVEDRDRAAAELARVLFARRRATTVDLSLRRGDGSRLPVAIAAGHLRGSRRSLQLVVRDLTERVRAETERALLTEQLAQAHRFETVGQLAGGLAHDLNNLLAVLTSNLMLADETLADLIERGSGAGSDELYRGLETLADDLGHLRGASDRVDALTRKLLQFASRAEADAEPVHVADLMEPLRDLLARSLGPAVELIVDVEGDVPDVLVDVGGLEQTLTNLILNARDAMPDGGRLTVSARREERATPGDQPPRPVAVIEVADEGTGMSDAVLARAFEPLYTTKSADRGSGLGLASVLGFVQRAGGSVHVDTEVGQGTCVRLVLPAAGPPEVVPPGAAAAPLVLLVDPAERSRRVIAAMLGQAGYRVAEVTSAERAHERLAEGDVDVLACELSLPGRPGNVLAAEVRAHGWAVPTVLLSSNPDVRGEIDGHPVLAKPFSSERLLEAVATVRAAAGVAPSDR